MSSSSSKKHNFPVHLLVWHNDYENLDEELKNGSVSASVKKTRSRFTQFLSVSLSLSVSDSHSHSQTVSVSVLQ